MAFEFSSITSLYRMQPARLSLYMKLVIACSHLFTYYFTFVYLRSISLFHFPLFYSLTSIGDQMPKISQFRTKPWRLPFQCGDTWVWEYLATTLSLAAMASIVGVLAKFNGQDIATWTFPYNITINSVIATLNTVSKSLLAFVISAAIGQWKWILSSKHTLRLSTFGFIDRASRGPLGSLQLMWDAKM